ncbi:MAG TPA: NAD-dependent epimerase/dehydratase family protein [Candidatus Eisenbacteria bacterium]|nr:NAD-dependent epimerase/dehydratase family protein [Candidatus Eisenbacteria bacterium]
MRPPYRPQRILLTGVTGTTGRLLLPALAGLGAPIRALTHRAEPDLSQRRHAEFRRGDLERPSSIRGIADGCDVVVHAARRGGFAILDRDRQRRIHVGGTEAVLREAQSAGASLFVLLGYTGTVQEREDVSSAVDETTPPEAEYVSDTVRLLYESEALVLEANRAAGLRTLVVSPGVLAAPTAGTQTVLGGLIGAFLRRELPYRMLEEVWLAVTEGSDLGRCVAGAITRGQGGRRYFATGECLQLHSLFERITRLTGVAAPRRRIPDLLVEELGLLTPLLPPQSFLRQLVLPRELVFHLRRLAPLANTRTRSELAFTPTPLEELLAVYARQERVPVRDVAGAAG